MAQDGIGLGGLIRRPQLLQDSWVDFLGPRAARSRGRTEWQLDQSDRSPITT